MFIINNSLKRDAKRTILTFTGSKYHTIKLMKLMSLFLNPQKRNSPTLTLENQHSAQHAKVIVKLLNLEVVEGFQNLKIGILCLTDW